MNQVIFLFLCSVLGVRAVGNCGVSEIESDSGDGSCVDQVALLVGGSNIIGWRSDGEIFFGEEFVQIGDYPYLIDAPYGFYAGPQIGVVICGGKNWADDIVETRCWQYNQCTMEWTHVSDMPVASSGGVGVPIQDDSGAWSLWIIGGGDGVNALPFNLVLTPKLQENGEIEWEWTQKNDLITERYGHCAVYHQDLKKIFVIAGRNEEVLTSVEIIDPLTGEIQAGNWSVEVPRWGLNCQYFEDPTGAGQIAVIGGMDSLFIPHTDSIIIDMSGTARRSGELPWSASGHIGIPMKSRLTPTIFGGFSLLGFQKKIAKFEYNVWTTESAHMSSSRVSGLAVAVPMDILDSC